MKLLGLSQEREFSKREGKRIMTSPILGEFIGTLVLILLGDGVVAGVLLKRSKAEGSGWMVITTGWAFAVVGGVFAAIACGSKDAFINPAVTLGFAISSGDYSKLLPYEIVQPPDGGSTVRRICRCASGVATLFAALEGNSRHFFQIGDILYRASDSKRGRESH